MCSKNLKVCQYHRCMSVPFYIDAEYTAKLNSETYYYAEKRFLAKIDTWKGRFMKISPSKLMCYFLINSQLKTSMNHFYRENFC